MNILPIGLKLNIEKYTWTYLSLPEVGWGWGRKLEMRHKVILALLLIFCAEFCSAKCISVLILPNQVMK